MFKCFISTFLLLTTVAIYSSEIPKSEEKRFQFYSKILEESKMMDLEIKADEQGLYLSNTQDYTVGKMLAVVSRKYIISGCDFYPFKDYLIGVLIKFTNAHPTKNNDGIIMGFSLVYHLLYRKLAKKERAKVFYEDMLRNNFPASDFFQYGISEEVQNYLNNLPTNKSNSVFSFDPEDIELAKKLGLETYNHEIAKQLYDFVYTDIGKLDNYEFKV